MGSTSFSSGGIGRRGQLSLRDNLSVAFRQAEAVGRALNEVAALSGEMRGGSLRDTLDVLGLGGLPLPSLSRARACKVPECDCPPADLGTLRRVHDRAERVELKARVRNATRQRREFALEMSKLMSQGGEAGGNAVVTPASVELDPGEVAVVTVAVDAQQHRPGVAYEGDLRIRAKDCDDLGLGICVRLAEERETVPVVDLHCCCHPNVRPLRWYHHYYCDPPKKEPPRDGHDRPPVG